jgi:electron transport complex protein RnfB
MLYAILIIVVLLLIIGGVLLAAASAASDSNEQAIERINALLPQTQCAQCGFPGCRPYASAILAGTADINQCPPGGKATIGALAALLNRSADPLDPSFGTTKPAQVAFIDESICIGCARCIEACPTDAIVGAAQFSHTVIANDCTGCELCLEPCPVDCIDLRSAQPANN